MTDLMDHDQVVDFLSAIVAYDNRTAGEANVAVWTEMAERGRWTLDEALDALHEHYATSTDFVMPAHIGDRIRATRRDAHERAVAERLALPPVDGSAELEAVHAEANERPCDSCRRPPGSRCVNRDGTERKIPHLCRMTGRADAQIGRRVPAA